MNRIPALLLVFGLVMLTVSGWFYSRTSSFIATAEKANGTVVELVRRSSSNGGSTYAPSVEFVTAQGEKVRFTSSSSSSPPSFSTGEAVEVFYSPQMPSEARINSFGQLWAISLVFALLGALFFCSGAGVFLFRFLRQNSNENLKANGLQISADIQEVLHDTSLKVNGQSPFRILAQWQDPATSNIHVFRSESIWFNPEKYISGKTITVYVSRENLKKHYMDTSFLPKLSE